MQIYIFLTHFWVKFYSFFMSRQLAHSFTLHLINKRFINMALMWNHLLYRGSEVFLTLRSFTTWKYVKLKPLWKIDWPQDHAVDNVYNDVYMTSLYSLNLVNVVIYIKKYFWNYNLYENYTIYGLVTKNGPQQRTKLSQIYCFCFKNIFETLVL